MSLPDELQRLHDLKEKGVLTESEFEAAKEALLHPPPVEAKPLRTPEMPAMPSVSANQWAMFLHFSQFAGFIVPVAGLVVPVLIWQLKKDSVPGLDEHGKIIANWLISSFIYAFISGLLTCIYIGFLGLAILIIMGLLFPIIGGIKANEGIAWKYPLAIEFLK